MACSATESLCCSFKCSLNFVFCRLRRPRTVRFRLQPRNELASESRSRKFDYFIDRSYSRGLEPIEHFCVALKLRSVEVVGETCARRRMRLRAHAANDPEPDASKPLP